MLRGVATASGGSQTVFEFLTARGLRAGGGQQPE